MSERRAYTRLEMEAGVFIVRGEDAWLTEVSDVSAGGAQVVRPERWPEHSEAGYLLYFILEKNQILCIKAHVVHEGSDRIGFTFARGYAVQAEQLLTASRTWL